MSKIKRWIVDRSRLALSHCPRAWPNLRPWGRKRSGRARRVEAAIAILSTCATPLPARLLDFLGARRGRRYS